MFSSQHTKSMGIKMHGNYTHTMKYFPSQIRAQLSKPTQRRLQVRNLFLVENRTLASLARSPIKQVHVTALQIWRLPP